MQNLNGHDIPVLGIAGGMGCGKTTMSERLYKVMRESCRPRFIMVDNLRYDFLCAGNGSFDARDELSRALGVPLDDCHEFYFPEISRAILANAESVDIFRRIVCPVLVQAAREEIMTAKGPVIIEGSSLLEEGFGCLLTEPLLMLTCQDDIRNMRITKRDEGRFTVEQIQQRLSREPEFHARTALAAAMGIQLRHLDTTTGIADGDVEELAAHLVSSSAHIVSNSPNCM